MGHPKCDPVLQALDGIVEVLTGNLNWARGVLEQADAVRRQRLAGHTYHDILEHAERPLIVERLSVNMSAIHKAGRELRIAEAQALRAEDVSMERIAQLFGVSRQRISALLRAAAPDTATHRRGRPPQGTERRQHG
jgi:hypothetical protein